jgi:hypothetical protein
LGQAEAVRGARGLGRGHIREPRVVADLQLGAAGGSLGHHGQRRVRDVLRYVVLVANVVERYGLAFVHRCLAPLRLLRLLPREQSAIRVRLALAETVSMIVISCMEHKGMGSA